MGAGQIRSQQIELVKVPGAENPADAFTKHVPRETLEKALSKIGMVHLQGRPACAPDTLGLQQ